MVGPSPRVDGVEHLHDDRDIGAAIILPGAVDVHVAQADHIEPVAVMEGARHRLPCDLGRAVEIPVVEGVILGHRLLDGVAIDRCGRGIDEPLHVLRDAGFEHVERAADVDVEGGARKVVAL